MKRTKKNDMPTARGALCSAVVNGKIFVMGGASNLLSGYSIVEEYDPATDTWTRKNEMSFATGNMKYSVVDKKVYVIGGYTRELGFTGLTEEYTPDTSTFSIFSKGKLPSKW